MSNLYDILCVSTSATPDQIRRAYRVLARRYHPDLNPTDENNKNAERFKQIASAYETLSDSAKRARYDAELKISKIGVSFAGAEKIFRAKRDRAYKQQANYSSKATSTSHNKNSTNSNATLRSSAPTHYIKKALNWIKSAPIKIIKPFKVDSLNRLATFPGKRHRKLSILEISLSVNDIMLGGKKLVEINEPEGPRKILITIPENARSGTVVRLHDTGGRGEELVVVIRLASHPFISIEPRGIVVEVPISIEEAALGAKILLPTLDEPQIVTIPAGTQSGDEIRLKRFGLKVKNGERGDIFYRALIKLPNNNLAIGFFDDSIKKVSSYYEKNIRSTFPNKLYNLTDG